MIDSKKTMTDQAIVSTLVATSNVTVLAGAALLMGMSTAAFTKSGKGKNAGAKAGFAFAGLFLLAGTGLLVYVAVKLMTTTSNQDDKKP